MRLALDLRAVTGAAERRRLAVEADRLGLWAVVTAGNGRGTEAIEAADLAAATSNVYVVLWLAASREHPFTLAEEIAVVDHLSSRRAAAVVDPDDADRIGAWLSGAIIDGVALAPPPAQTRVPIWSSGELPMVELSGDLAADRAVIDEQRDVGVTHLAVTWPGPLPLLARHLATRAATPGFPQVVADLADELPGVAD